jgi:hypothetical protein
MVILKNRSFPQICKQDDQMVETTLFSSEKDAGPGWQKQQETAARPSSRPVAVIAWLRARIFSSRTILRQGLAQ